MIYIYFFFEWDGCSLDGWTHTVRTTDGAVDDNKKNDKIYKQQKKGTINLNNDQLIIEHRGTNNIHCEH